MTKKANKQPVKNAATGGRVRKLDKKRTKEKAKKEAAKQPAMPSSFKLVRQVFSVLKKNWKVLGGITLVYLILNIVFAGGVLTNLSASLSTARQTHSLSDAFNGFGSLLSLGSSSGNAQAGSSAAQSLLLVLVSLVMIWALRQLLAGEKIRVKQAYYSSMTPLVPFFLVILVILLQLLPLTVGSALVAIALSSTVSGGGLLAVIFGFFFLVLAAWSVYMVSASVFGLYIVTLPDMQPRQALRSAGKLVRYRRWPLLRRLLFLPIFIFITLGIITIPFILFIPFIAAPLFFVLLTVVVLVAHTYLYSLYRGLIA